MPRRKKPSERDAKASIARSLREYGLNTHQSGPHSVFFTKIVSLVHEYCRLDSSAPIELDDENIPADRIKAIELVYTNELKEYLTDKTEVTVEYLQDHLQDHLCEADDESRILNVAPYYFRRYGERMKKSQFERFDEALLDPLQRFTSSDEESKVTISPASDAFEDMFTEDCVLLGYAFEALFASYAVHNVNCRCCHAVGSLKWCGGSATSWRDLYCVDCQSCYEVKSKANKRAMDRIFSSGKLYGGSFAEWCRESFPDRVKGKDYIVLVSRERSKDGWIVDIAEVGTVLPIATERTFTLRSIKTVVSLVGGQRWFCIPGGDLPDLDTIFRKCFDQVFPDQWEKVYADFFLDEESSSSTNEEGAPNASRLTTRNDEGERADVIAALVAELDQLSTSNWDDSD